MCIRDAWRQLLGWKPCGKERVPTREIRRLQEEAKRHGRAIHTTTQRWHYLITRSAGGFKYYEKRGFDRNDEQQRLNAFQAQRKWTEAATAGTIAALLLVATTAIQQYQKLTSDTGIMFQKLLFIPAVLFLVATAFLVLRAVFQYLPSMDDETGNTGQIILALAQACYVAGSIFFAVVGVILLIITMLPDPAENSGGADPELLSNLTQTHTLCLQGLNGSETYVFALTPNPDAAIFDCLSAARISFLDEHPFNVSSES